MSGSFPKTRLSAFDSLEVGEIFFSNLLLLGFDPAAMERKHRIPFNKEMFALPNKKGFEAVALFLFTHLDEARCQEEFRDCWQVRDKKEEQMFRKVCNNWLAQIAKDDPNSFLPRIVSSLFMSPGGDKFTQFMLCFSRYVIHRVMLQEHGAKGVRDFLNHPVLTLQNYIMAPVIANGIVAGSIRQRQKFVQVVQDSVFLHDEWNKYALDQIKDYRQKVKKLRDLNQAVNDENLKLTERGSSNSSPSQTKYKSGASVYDSEIQAVKRAHIVQQVRNMWKVFDDFRSIQCVDREVIDSILQGTLEKYKVDASELNIKIPDLLLRRCEQELQRRNVDNIYQGGNVNLLSLIHLWNLSLHLYAEKLHEAGVPKLDSVVPNLTTMVETHRAHCTNSENLRHQLELRLLPDLKQSIEHLKQELDRQLLSSVSPASIRITTLGFGLVPPTPPLSFEPQDSGLTEKGHLVTEKLLRRNKNKVTTPDAASQLVKDINDKVRSQHSALAQGIPVYAPTDKIRGTDKPTISTREVGHLQYSDVNRATKPKSVVKQPLKQEKIIRLPAASDVRRSQQQKLPTTKQLPLRTVASKPVVAADSRNLPSSRSMKQVSSRPVVGKVSDENVQPLIGKVDRHYGVIASKTHIQNDPMDMLAAKIASTVSLDSPDGKENNQKNSFENLYHEDAFQSREKLEHTPPSSKRATWQDTLLSDSIGPLSSTHVESPLRISVDHRENEEVAVKLFPEKLSGGIKGATDVMSDQTNSEENMPHISRSYQAFEMNSPQSTRTPSTICSASPINSETEEDSDDERPSDNQFLGLRNSELIGIVNNRESRMNAVESKVDCSRVTNEEENCEKKNVVTEELNKVKVQEDAYEELNRLGHNSQNEMLDCSFRSLGFRTVDFVKNDEEVGNLYKRHDVADSLSISEDESLVHLNETLQFLRETKTPRLPTRAAQLTGKQDLAFPNKNQLQEAMNQNFKHNFTSEQFHPRVKDFLHDGNISLPVKLNSSDIDFITAGDTSLQKSNSLHGKDSSNLSVKTLPIRGPMKVRMESGEINAQSENVQNGLFDLEKVSYSGSDLGAGDCILNSSLQPKDTKICSLISSHQKSALESSVDSDRSSVDNLVLRYQKLRLQKDDAKQMGEFMDIRQNLAAAPISASLDHSNSSSNREGKSLQPRESISPAGFNNSSTLDTFLEPSKKAANCFETPSLNKWMMLQDEDFADIKLLLDSSLTTSPNLNTSHRMSLQPGDYLMPSPLTDAVHSTEVSFARLNDSAINLLDINASILVPSSPANQDLMSVATGELIDFS